MWALRNRREEVGSLGMGWGWILEYEKEEEQEDGAEGEKGEKRNVSESRRQRQEWHIPGLEGKEEQSIECPGLTEA